MTVKVTKPAINVREELADLRKPSGVAGEAMLRAETPQEQFNLIGAGRRNLLINGSFRVSQRGDYTSASTMTHNVYMLDRWKNAAGVASTIQDLGGYVEVKATAASGASTTRIFQLIEDLYLLEGQTVTVSCEMKSNSPNGRLMMHNGSWVATDATHSGGGGWESLSFTTVMPDSLTVTSVQVGIDGNASADVPIAIGDYCQIKNVQLEVGPIATPFEHRSYGEELAACQRYFERIEDNKDMICVCTSFTTQAAYGSIDYKVEKRTSPEITFTGGASNYRYRNAGNNTTLVGIGATSINSQNFRIDVDCGAGNITAGQSGWLSENTGATGISIDAEL